MKIVFMGTPSFAVPILKMLHQKHEVCLVVTQPDKKVGRKKILTPSKVKKEALDLGLEVFQPEKLKDNYQKIIDLKPDYLVTAAYGQMLPKALIDQVTCLNVHGSILPNYRGGAPIQYALFDGLKETGVTIMYMAFEMDSGDIIKQDKLPILESDDYESLSEKLSYLGVKLLDEVLEDLNHGIIHRTPQDKHKVTFAYTLKPEDEYLNFHQSTERVLNKIRGLSPEPGAYARIHDTHIKIYKASKSDIINRDVLPGTILSINKKLVIATLDGAIEVLLVQLPGKKILTIKDFLNGQNIIKQGDVFIEGMKKDA
ncbi:MAG: methionyl-tRNA formyltransferase [Tenericutes bacterium HGW-Tenericutes-6]|nr:MAG: methionyl-tRNA formyltransferase [Tenericutes bacterium HGW-Tenericutes-6]